ncbi:MAG: hypothetical protein NZ908_01755 [Candidatus Micrarchaeota archaeon]|nr:hypothetical protein [Candidatus Micrarchaeota archaeon]MCX8154401.1 hypothetical protein [Candidatus Micrarchaeota archaeon]
MRGQLTLEIIIIYGLQIVTLGIVIGVVFALTDASIKAIEKYNTLKERAFIRDIVSEICALGNGVRYSIYVKYNHSIRGEDLGCWGGSIELEGGYEYTIQNFDGSVSAFRRD